MQSAAIDPSGKQAAATRRPSRRAEILRTSARLFVELGFEATSIRQIVHRNRISRAGLYYHFKSKQDLLAAIMHYSMDLLDRAREEVIAHCRSHEDRLRRMVHEHALGLTRPDDAAFTVLALGEIEALLPEDRGEITRRRRAHFEFVQATLDGLKAEGRLHDLNTTVAAFTVMGMVHWITRWYERRGQLTAEQVADEVTKMVMQSVIRPD
jgi:AcrR family transcriptional regulator